jgi:ferredoxin
LFDKPTEHTENFINEKFAKKPEIAEGNIRALKVGWNYGEKLKPGGYGRLAPMVRGLADAIRDESATTLAGFRDARLQSARAAGHRDTVAAHTAHVLGAGIGPYHLDGNTKMPREVDHDLEMWGCVACNFCVTVCPNDAFFKLPTGDLDLDGRQQYFVFTELCNECGNCLTFCPEVGDPAQVKPRLFLERDRFEQATGPRFLIHRDGERWDALAGGGADEHVPTLVALLDADEGLPLVP